MPKGKKFVRWWPPPPQFIFLRRRLRCHFRAHCTPKILQSTPLTEEQKVNTPLKSVLLYSDIWVMGKSVSVDFYVSSPKFFLRGWEEGVTPAFGARRPPKVEFRALNTRSLRKFSKTRKLLKNSFLNQQKMFLGSYEIVFQLFLQEVTYFIVKHHFYLKKFKIRKRGLINAINLKSTWI